MPIAADLRRALGELVGEAGDIILLVVGLAIVFWALPKIIGVGGAIKGFIPGQTATLGTTGTVGQLTSVYYDPMQRGTHGYPYFQKSTRGYIPAREFIRQLVRSGQV